MKSIISFDIKFDNDFQKILRKIFIFYLLLNMNSFSMAQSPNFLKMMDDPTINYFTVVDSAENYFNNNQSQMDDEDGIYADYLRWKKYWQPRIGYLNGTPGDRTQASHIVANYLFTPICTSQVSQSANWKSLGPNSYPAQSLGKITAIYVDRANDPTLNTVYVGTPGSGVFRTFNFRNSNP